MKSMAQKITKAKAEKTLKAFWNWCGDSRTVGFFQLLTGIAAVIGLWISITTAMSAVEQNRNLNRPNIQADFGENFTKFGMGNLGPASALNLRGEILFLHVNGGEAKEFKEKLKFGLQKLEVYDSESFSTGFNESQIQDLKSGTVFIIAKICSVNMDEPYVKISFKNMADTWDWKRSDRLMYSIGKDQQRLLKPFLEMSECS